jgi:hypothetical protein
LAAGLEKLFEDLALLHIARQVRLKPSDWATRLALQLALALYRLAAKPLHSARGTATSEKYVFHILS